MKVSSPTIDRNEIYDIDPFAFPNSDVVIRERRTQTVWAAFAEVGEIDSALDEGDSFCLFVC